MSSFDDAGVNLAEWIRFFHHADNIELEMIINLTYGQHVVCS